MRINSEKLETIFRNEFEDRVSYSTSITKKDANGSYITGYIPVNFRYGVDLKNKTKIKIKDAWLSFYKNNNKTIPTIFINEFEISQDGEETPKLNEEIKNVKEKVDFDIGKQIQITDDDLPF